MKNQERFRKLEKDNQFNYMLLSRCKMDIDYFFGNGQLYGNHLYFGEIKKHITGMIDLWKTLPLKPMWLRATSLIDYKKRVNDFIKQNHENN
jgi:hypothetical protein